MPKVILTFKTPDAVSEAAVEAAASLKTDEEKDDYIHKVCTLAEKWVEHGELVCLELDTDEESIKVCEVE